MAFKLINKKLPKNFVKKEEEDAKMGSGSNSDSVNMEVDKGEGRGSQEHMPGPDRWVKPPDLSVKALCRHLRMNIHPGGFSNSGAWEAPPPGPTYIYIYICLYIYEEMFI